MSDSQQAIDRHAIEFRAVLGALGAIQVIDGVWALLGPSSFYGDFPFGRGWVAALPAYNEHLMRDVGSLFIATGFVLLMAAFYLDRRLVLTAILSYLLFSVPHAIYHFFNLEPYRHQRRDRQRGHARALGAAAALAPVEAAAARQRVLEEPPAGLAG